MNGLMCFPLSLGLRRARVVAAMALSVVTLPAAGMAQQFQLGWSVSTSQGRGSSSSASQTTRATAINAGVQLINASATSQPGIYAIVDLDQPFLVLQDSDTTRSASGSNTASFSTLTGFGASVFHTPVNP
jgi:hypothetical protein